MIPSSDNPLGYRFYEDGGFPDSYQGATFKTDFRIWLRRQYVMDDERYTELYKANKLINLCYKEIPKNMSIESLFKGINWFGCCGESDRIELLKLPKKLIDDLNTENESENNEEPKFSYFWDFKEVWASFYTSFNIDLYQVKDLHWWAFTSLIKSLDSESAVGRIINIRTPDYSKKQKRSVVISKWLAKIPKVK
jgi:hypothetical protein